MGKPSIPTPPKPESSSQIAEATKETAEHMARLQSAMEFGDEMLKYSTAEDGSSVRYEVDKAEVPKGSTAKYEDQEVTSWGPKAFRYHEPHRGWRTITFDGDGNITDAAHTEDRKFIPKGTHYSKVMGIVGDESRLDKGQRSELIDEKSYTSTSPRLTGHTDPDGNFIPVGDYYRIDKAADGTTTRTKVERDEAVDHDFSGMGDIDRALKRWEFEKETSGEVADHMLSQARKYGLGEDGFIDTAVEMIKKSDETGYAAREMLGKLAQEYEPGELPELPELQKMVDPAVMERAGIAPLLPEVGLGDVPEYERAGAFGDLDRLGREPTLEELARGDAPGLERAGEMDALRRAGATPEFGQIGAAGGIERAGEMAGLGRIGAAPTMRELGAGPELERAGEIAGLGQLGEFGGYERAGEMAALERAKEMGDLERLAAFGGLERAEGIGDIQRAGEMAALERAEAAPTLERLAAGDIPEIPIDPESLAGRQFAERQFLDRAQSGRTAQLMGERARRLARGRAAGLGNIFGGGAVIEEAAQVQEAEDAAQRAAMGDLMGFLQSGQTAGDYQARVAQQNLQNRLLGIQQRTGAETGEFGMGMQRLGAAREAALQERADQLGAIGQRNQAEEQEYRAALQTLDANRQAGLQEYGLETQRRSFANEQALREQASRMETLGQRTGAQQAEYQAGLQAMGQRTAAAGGEYGFEAQRIDQQNTARLQERADQLGAIAQRTGAEQQEYQNLQGQLAQINTARQSQFGMEAQGLGINQQAQLQERADQLGAIGQRTGAQQQEYQNLLSQLEQQNTAMERGFQLDIQAAGFDNEAALRERTDQLSAIAQRTGAEQQEFANLGQIVSQMNQTRTGQFGMGGQRLEANTMQRMRERQDELSAKAQRNQAEEAEFQGLLSALGQQAGTRQAQYGLDMQGIQQRNVAAQQDLAGQQQAMAQRNQAAQQSFTSAMQKAGTQEQMKQQQMANLQSFSGLAPVSSQFGMLQGAQQAAQANFMPLQYQPTNAMQMLQGQQQMAASNFGTQANIYGTQAKIASQPSGFGQILGTVAGGWAGSAAGGNFLTGGIKKLNPFGGQ